MWAYGIVVDDKGTSTVTNYRLVVDDKGTSTVTNYRLVVVCRTRELPQ